MFEARRTLETKYQQMGRGLSSSAVDQEGAAIWITEYLRYRTNGCDHAEREAKVFTQIDGGPVPPTCFVPVQLRSAVPACINTGATSSTQGFEVRPVTRRPELHMDGAEQRCLAELCQRALARLRVLRYLPTTSRRTAAAIAPGSSTSPGRAARARYQVNQAGTPFVASLHDGRSVPIAGSNRRMSAGSGARARRVISRPPPTCRAGSLHLSTGRPVTSTGRRRRSRRSGTLECLLSFSDACGGAGSAPKGTPADLIVTLTITDSLGNSVTIRSRGQPPLRVRLFSC